MHVCRLTTSKKTRDKIFRRNFKDMRNVSWHYFYFLIKKTTEKQETGTLPTQTLQIKI